MPILSNGQTVTDDQAKSITDYFATNPNANQIAERAASLGLTKDQLASAAGYANFGTNQAANIDSYLNNNTSGYGAGANGVITKADDSNSLTFGGKTYTQQQIQNAYKSGGNVAQFISSNGGGSDANVTILANKARKLGGSAVPTGDAALQNYFQQYRKMFPTGADANNYESWLAHQNPGHVGSMRMGDFTGIAKSAADFLPGGLYGPRSDISQYWTPDNAGTGAGGSVGGGGIIGGARGGGGGGGGGSSSSSSSSGGTAPWNVTPDQTVEGRINGILNPNNPIIQQARTRSMQSMNDRGLANSSLAVTAGDSAAYEAAIPIAAADAATFAKASGYNADQINQFTQAELNRQSQMAQAQLSANTQLTTAQLSAETQKYIAGLDGTQKAQAQDLQLKNATLLNTNSQAAQIFNTGMSAINNITNNAQMDANTKTQATANVWHDIQRQLKVIETTSGLNLTSQLNFSGYPGFDDKGQWVGFNAASDATPANGATPAVGDTSWLAGGGGR